MPSTITCHAASPTAVVVGVLSWNIRIGLTAGVLVYLALIAMLLSKSYVGPY